ncbi:unnamed protein product [Callosobruchus maculatus]|uniref:Uncharacterized protein n=1 Tax=Callosobruchus maculatus TaxID=64391 RepID=A0A653CII6_CALMS|nr:unnamed protein product [Callosobruchus maculatus]
MVPAARSVGRPFRLRGCLSVCSGVLEERLVLMDVYVYPQDPVISALISTCIGIGGHLFFALSQNWFQRLLHPSSNRLVFYVGSRLYTECFAIVCVNGWRGPWQLLDIHSRKQCFTVLATTMVGVVALISVRGLRNVTAPPFIIVRDNVKGYFEVITMFRLSLQKSIGLYLLDCLFSVVVVGILVVFIWRGSWILVDIFLYPEDLTKSAWGSLVIGYVAVVTAFLLQPCAKYLCDKASGTSRLLISDIVNLYALFGTVNVWRGIWNLLEIYFIPDDIVLSCWITHIVSFSLLILMSCSNSLLVRGVYIDAEEPAGKCMEFPCYYFRVMFQERQLRKLRKIHMNKGTYSTYEEKPNIDKSITISVIHNIIVENSTTTS